MTEPNATNSLIKDYKRTFEGPEGERVLANLSMQCYENDPTFVDGNPNGTAFNEGKRFVLLHIRRLIAAQL